MIRMLASLATLGMTAACLGALAAGPAAAAGGCLWAGGAHPQGAAVVAGNWLFTCRVDGGPHWLRGQAVAAPSTVPNPGADSHPASGFSLGALQPGTDFDGYCVGNQLVQGDRYVYESAADGHGGLVWLYSGPIGMWSQGRAGVVAAVECRDSVAS